MTVNSSVRTLIILTVLLGIAAFGIISTAPQLFGAENGRAVIIAAMVCIGAALPAVAIPLLLIPANPKWLVEAGMGSMVTRMLLTAAAGWVAYRLFAPPKSVYLNALTICYLILLTIETGVTWRTASRHWNRAGAS